MGGGGEKLIAGETHVWALDPSQALPQCSARRFGWRYRPEGLTSAQLNLPYCVATLLLDGDVFIDQFTEAMVADPARMALAEKVHVEHDAEITGRGSGFRHMVRVEVFLKDGTRLTDTVEAPRGSEHSFASEADVVAKFHKLAGHRMSRDKADRLAEAILGAERLADAGEISRALQG